MRVSLGKPQLSLWAPFSRWGLQGLSPWSQVPVRNQLWLVTLHLGQHLTAPIYIVEDREGILLSAPPSEYVRWFLQISVLQEIEDDSFQGNTTCQWISLGHTLWFFASRLYACFFHCIMATVDSWADLYVGRWSVIRSFLLFLLRLYHDYFTFNKNVSFVFNLSRSGANDLRKFCCSSWWCLWL